METILGIDLGTSSVKVVILDGSTKKIIAASDELHNATVDNKASATFNEQNVAKIFGSLENCMKTLEKNYSHYLSNVKCISVCGQMHGCVLWKASDVEDSTKVDQNAIEKFAQNDNVASHLITWQDQRADESFLRSLPTPDSHMSVHSGYGCVNLFWLQLHAPNSLLNYDCASTLADLLVVLLCKLSKPLMTEQNAANWGYCDVEKRSWNNEILNSINFPLHFLPKIVESGCIAGRTKYSWHSIPESVIVLCSFGDFQCTVNSKLTENTAVLNISTSAQLSLRMTKGFIPAKIESNRSSSICFFPYFHNSYLAVAASLNGGNILSSFVNVLSKWTTRLTGTIVPEEKIWSKILNNDEEELGNENKGFIVKPTLFGERHEPSIGFSVQNLFASDDFSLNYFTQKLIESVVLNLNEMMPKEFLIENHIDRLILSGQASKSYFKKFIERLYGDHMQISSDNDSVADAALGCALIACSYLKTNKV